VGIIPLGALRWKGGEIPRISSVLFKKGICGVPRSVEETVYVQFSRELEYTVFRTVRDVLTKAVLHTFIHNQHKIVLVRIFSIKKLEGTANHICPRPVSISFLTIPK
jgi:hypothetical protein